MSGLRSLVFCVACFRVVEDIDVLFVYPCDISFLLLSFLLQSEHLHMDAEVTYAIKGDKANFIILTAVGESKITVVPYGYKDGQVQTTIK